MEIFCKRSMAIVFEEINMPTDGSCRYVGYKNAILLSPDGRRRISIKYEGEPPHGDSYHSIQVDGIPLPGLAWGDCFAFTPCSRFLALSWMAKKYERNTVVIAFAEKQWTILPEYIGEFDFVWPTLDGRGSSNGQQYVFDETEQWYKY